MNRFTGASRRLAACCAALWMLATPAPAREVRVYEVQHRVAAELVPLVQTALGDSGRVVADVRSNTLVITGERAAVGQAIDLLSQLDARLRTVVLRYATEDVRSLAQRGVRVDWRVEAGGLRIGHLHGAKGSEGVAARVRLGGSETEQRGDHRSLLRILEGETGRIASGIDAPLVTRRVLHTPRGPVVRESARLVSAESGFEARPRVLGDGRIELSLRPFHDRLGPDGRIETAGAETRVVVSPGETLVLGGLSSEEQGKGRQLLSGADRRDAAGERLLLVTADVE